MFRFRNTANRLRDKFLNQLSISILFLIFILLFSSCATAVKESENNTIVYGSENNTIVYGKENVTMEGILVEGFEDLDDWTLIAGEGASMSIDTTHFLEGTNGLKIHTENGNIGVFEKDGTFDFSRGSNIFFSLYVDDVSKWEDFIIYLVVTPWSKYKCCKLTWLSDRLPGWNRILISKNDFETEGDASWDDTFTRIRFNCVPMKDETVNVTIDALRTDYQGKPVCIITFDDGKSSVYDKAFPILNSNGQQAVAFVVPDLVGQLTTISKTQLDILQNAGWDISNHSKSHANLSKLNVEELEEEVNGAYQWLVDNGYEKGARFFAYPGGRWNEIVINKVKERHKLARSGIYDARLQPHLSGLGEENYLITTMEVQNDVSVDMVKDYIDNAINQKGLLVLLLHAIVDENAKHGEYLSEDFKEISDYLKIKESDISVMTFSEYVDWLSSWDSGETSSNRPQ